MAEVTTQKPSKIITLVFVSLVIDLLAFTMPLPLFPRLIDSFLLQESANHQTSLLSRLLHAIRSFRNLISPTSQGLFSEGINRRKDTTLLGGLLGSVFSFAQFIISPWLGKAADSYGRRPVLLATMVGNIASALLWLFGSTFPVFLLSRIVGGLSEGNTQLAIAIIADVTNSATRAKGMALVGLAFSLCFTLGPPMGAYFAAKPLFATQNATLFGLPLNVYALPAAMTVSLLVFETALLYISLPETKNYRKEEEPSKGDVNGVSMDLAARKAAVSRLQSLHFWFLFVFSGAEFTLTFLTFDLYNYSNAQNGKLLGSIGIISAILQGGFVRRYANKIGSGRIAHSGIRACFMSLVALAILPQLHTAKTELHLTSPPETVLSYQSKIALVIVTLSLAWTSATVVNSLNSLVSLHCSDSEVQVKQKQGLPKGETLGKFRSSGQLGRALGPLFITTLYYLAGPTISYGIAAVGMLHIMRGYSSVLRGSAKAKTS